MLEVPFKALSELRNRIQKLRLKRLHREKWDQPDHRPHLERNCLTIWQVQNVIEKTIGFIPQSNSIPHVGHRLSDLQKVLEEFRGDLFVDMVARREFQSDSHKIQTVHRHPAGSVRLVDVSARGKGSTPIEYSNIIKAEESALKHVSTGGVLAIDPPGEIQHQLVKNAFQEGKITRIVRMLVTPALAIDLKDAPGGPSVDRRIYVAKSPFVRGQLSVWMHVPYPCN